jgi:hypothetical protein
MGCNSRCDIASGLCNNLYTVKPGGSIPVNVDNVLTAFSAGDVFEPAPCNAAPLATAAPVTVLDENSLSLSLF